MGLIVDLSAAARDGTRLSYADGAQWNFTGDFTVELFEVTFSATSTSVLIAQYNATGNQRSWELLYTSGTGLQLVLSTNGTATTVMTYTWTPSLGTPYDIAFDRSGSDVRIYVDGSVVDGPDTVSGALFNSTAGLSVGHLNGASDFAGTFKAVRITNGVARYAGAYTPPTLPLPTS